MSEPLRDDDEPDDRPHLPMDPDLDPPRRPQSSPFEATRRARWPRFRPDVIAAVFVGGCIGGYARYAATTIWPTPTGRFPWAIFWVNVAGAFVLAVVIVIAADVAPSRYLRPLVGTGFCGALTTFSSVVVAVDQLFAHGHAGTAAAYLLGTVVAGLAAAVIGLVLGRAIAADRRRQPHERSPR